ncbi:MAG TPA: AMP-binding protein, partial [Acidimicrobiia bacterium]
GLAGAGVGAGDTVGVLCRNHRGFVETTVALGKLGADALLLNTGFAAAQIADVAAAHTPRALVYDDDLASRLGNLGPNVTRIRAWPVDERAGGPTVDELIAAGPPTALAAPDRAGRLIVLTSATTGPPRGAARGPVTSVDGAVALLARIPLRSREATMIAAPLFHSWGFAHFALGLSLRSTLVLRRRFDAEATLAAVASTRATALVVVPVMLRRILALGPERLRARDVSSLRVVAASGSPLTASLATRFMDEFGEVLYNLYGSTEVAWATVATPDDLRAAPGTAGRLPRGTVVRVFDDHGHDVAPGSPGRIFVGNRMLFEGYTGGGTKETIRGLMSTGDVGHFDGAGRLFVDGRDDDMIVSGGENVFPSEVEELLARHPAIEEAAVVGVPDDEFGQRLKAFVVTRAGAELTADDVRGLAREQLARFKVPREVEFVDDLPRNETGKIVKRALP